MYYMKNDSSLHKPVGGLLLNNLNGIIGRCVGFHRIEHVFAKINLSMGLFC